MEHLMTFLSAETRTKGEAVGEGFLIYKNSFSYRPVGFVLRTFKKSNTQVLKELLVTANDGLTLFTYPP